MALLGPLLLVLLLLAPSLHTVLIYEDFLWAKAGRRKDAAVRPGCVCVCVFARARACVSACRATAECAMPLMGRSPAGLASPGSQWPC